MGQQLGLTEQGERPAWAHLREMDGPSARRSGGAVARALSPCGRGRGPAKRGGWVWRRCAAGLCVRPLTPTLSRKGRGGFQASRWASNVTYVFQFGAVFASFPALLAGALLTIELSAGAMVFGLALAVVCAFAKTSGKRWLRWLVTFYVEVIRNTPFLVQLFIIYFALPQLGLLLDANEAALLAMVVNLGAYATEIVRAGIEAVPHGQIDAGPGRRPDRAPVFRLIAPFSGPEAGVSHVPLPFTPTLS